MNVAQMATNSWRANLAALALMTTTGGCGCLNGSPSVAPPAKSQRQESPELAASVQRFCGDCHVVPRASSFPQQAWHDEVEQGYHLYLESGRTDLSPPPQTEVFEYFRSRAPVSLEIPVGKGDPSSFASAWKKAEFFTVETLEMPAISFLGHESIESGQPAALFSCDMRSGEVAYSFLGGEAKLHSIARLNNPCHVRACDLDRDGLVDLVVADLGSFDPADHDRGRVVWLRHEAAGEWKPIVVTQGLGRVADVQPADFDGDGDLDLVVAEFGWRKTGRILLLKNGGGAEPRFETVVLDSRHGAIHVPVADFDADGDLDFVALISQEHETIEAFLNQGDGTFSKQTIYAAGDPSYGSSGIELVDLDADGDLDVLYTNGDTFDSLYMKPYHGISWLENRGEFPFVMYPLAAMPGVYRALAGDLDGDKDLDIAAAAFLPRESKPAGLRDRLDALIVLEQTSPGEFSRHVIERGNPRFAALSLADLDGDGDLDLAAGAYLQTTAKTMNRLTVWWNERHNLRAK